MARRKLLTDEGVAALKPKSKRYAHPDPELPSHYIRVTPSGSQVFSSLWSAIGRVTRNGRLSASFPTYPIDAARKRAGEIIRARREGRSAPNHSRLCHQSGWTFIVRPVGFALSTE